ncbi:MAG: 2-oxoglutarate synthase [Rhodospirillales bacterium RIFCSPLOWO2_12_FULL_58_28]|nr:MAG: 2-oxoglutarate synthase [Rhodospirillales bacterium RIFCSPLOWO2_02_FULL_58_16]OHC77530.1 MAG: 2-oxoglutarate synthase [Rhodospirillales bacterium RIFCSPLOWO2_12_FULL_58_28]
MDSVNEDCPLSPKDYKSDYKPVWCPGCGDFSVLAAITRALSTLKIKRENAAVISGIGCSSRIPAYTSVYGFHGVHGRALPLAAGLKLARPDLTVLVTGGDGDGFSIGGNHFIHACRRNVDMTYIVMDNQVYGMTKGQASPTTAIEWKASKLTPHGTGVDPFQPLGMALAAGATFIARGYSGDPDGVAELIVKAVRHPGFSFLQVLSPCVTYHPEQREWKDKVRPAPSQPAVDPVRASMRLMDEEGFNIGVLFVSDRPPYAPPTAPKATIADIEKTFAI